MTVTTQSMTAFGRHQVRTDQGEAICELRSVNHRYLEVSVRLPEGYAGLESGVRKSLTSQVARGKVDCQILWRSDQAKHGLFLDRQLLDELMDVSQKVQDGHPVLAPLAVGDVLRWPGVLVQAPALDVKAFLEEAFEGALVEFLGHRQREGQQLVSGLSEKLEAVLKTAAGLKGALEGELAAFRARLRARIEGLKVSLDAGRLEQEIALLAARSDVEEEIERLGVHALEVRQALATSGPVGRRLDFLMQELHREANTLGSKALSARVSSAAVEIKVLIEQMREQVQNIE